MPFAISSKSNRVQVFVRARQTSSNRVSRSWEVIDTYSSGTGFITDPLDLPSSAEQDCAIDIAYGYPVLGELISTRFEYEGEFTSAEKEIVEWTWEQARQFDDERDLRRAVLFSDQNWYISLPKMIVPSPFLIEHVDRKTWLDSTTPLAYNTISN